MNTTFISFIIGLLLIVGVGGVVYMQKAENDAMMQPTEQVGDAAINTASGLGNMMDDDGDEDDDSMMEDGTMETGNTGTPSGSTGGSIGSDTGSTQTSEGITAAVVAQHNMRTSCWSSINGNVYDLTSWIPNHPGGEQAIVLLCGTDGSEKFNRKHGGGKQQATILAGFKIGILAN